MKIKSRKCKMQENNVAVFNCFFESLKNATAKIEKGYFDFQVAGTNNTIFRERVYCYELYHNMRCLLGDILPYKLQGEVDKSGNPTVPSELQDTKPDFIFHIPGTQSNLVVMEVKSIKNKDDEIKDDINKLKKFIYHGYSKVIMLIYGNNENKLKYARSEIDNLTEQANHILLLWHKAPGEPAKEYNSHTSQ